MNHCARVLLFLTLMALAHSAQAGAIVWTANGGNGVWTEPGNWNGGVGPAPGPLDTAIFNASGTSNCIMNRTNVGAIDVQAGYTGTLSNLGGLKGYWPLDEVAGTVAADVSGAGNNCTYFGASGIVAGAPTAFANPSARSFFTGQTARSTTFTWPANSAVTVAFWNYMNSADVATSISSAFSVAPYNTDPLGSRFTAHVPWSDGTLYWDYGDYNGNYAGTRLTAFYGNATTPGYCDKWTHVTLVSGGPSGNFQAIYFDGVLAASKTTSLGLNVANIGITIGALYDSWPHRGRIDDFRIYDRVLSPEEIAALGQDSPVGGGFNAASSVNIADGTFNPGKATTYSGPVTVNGGAYLGAAQPHAFNAGLSVLSGTFTGGTGAISVLGTLQQSGGTFTAPPTLTFGGALFNRSGGTFNHNGGTVQFTGTGQTLSGSTTFNHFNKTVAAADTLTFAASSTQTVAGTMTLRGGSTATRLALRSTVPGTRANIVPTGSRNVDFVDVQDSNNSTFPKIFTNQPPNSLNSGNNIGWFNLPPTAAADSYTTSENTPLAVALAAGVLLNDADTDAPPDALVASLVSAPANGLVTFNADGSFNYVPQLGFDGVDSFTYQTSDRTVTLPATTVTITVNQVFATLTLSGPTATPNPAVAGTAVEFTALSNLGGATFVWNFGDGSSTRPGVQVNHVFASAGVYPVTVTVTHADSGQSKIGALNLTVNASAGAGGGTTPGTTGSIDSDGDGFVDELEIAAGSNPNSAAGTPYGLANPGTPELLNVDKILITLSFKRAGADSIRLGGSVPVAAGFSPIGQRVLLSIGGIAKTFLLDGKGTATDGNAQMKMKYNSKKGGSAKFALQMKAGSYQNTLADENLTNADVRSDRRVVKVWLVMGKAYYREVEALYTAKQGNIGKTK